MTPLAKCGLDDWFAQGNTREDLIPLVVDRLPEMSAEAQAAALRLQTRKASMIEAKDVEWVWEPWLPVGMVGLLAGYGGGGKSTVALHIAAACSVGGMLPDGQGAPLLNTLIFAAEDSPEHTIIPRLTRMGADLDRIHIVDGIVREGNDPGWVQLRNHVPATEHAARAEHVFPVRLRCDRASRWRLESSKPSPRQGRLWASVQPFHIARS